MELAAAGKVAEALGIPVATNGPAALQDALDRAHGDLLWAAVKVAGLPEEQLKQRDLSGRFERPSVWLEIYERCFDRYARVAQECVRLGIAAVAVDVVRREAGQVQALLAGVLADLGHRWEDPRVVEVVDSRLRMIEGSTG